MNDESSFAHAIISPHAVGEITRRQLPGSVLQLALSSPEQVLPVRTGRVVLHRRFSEGKPSRDYLLRVFVDVDYEPPVVVTVYRTSKIAKYWSTA